MKSMVKRVSLSADKADPGRGIYFKTAAAPIYLKFFRLIRWELRLITILLVLSCNAEQFQEKYISIIFGLTLVYNLFIYRIHHASSARHCRSSGGWFLRAKIILTGQHPTMQGPQWISVSVFVSTCLPFGLCVHRHRAKFAYHAL